VRFLIFKQINLHALTSLSRLQSLTIEASGLNRTYPGGVGDDTALQLAMQQFPGRLSSLTQLWFPLGVLHNIKSVSQCVNLRDLRLLHTDDHNGVGLPT
jgi:hypothetical protein